MKRREASLQFVGGAQTVTGSKHWLQVNGRSFLLDCGLFQGLKPLRLRNWAAPPFEPAAIDAAILSHAHIDHSGYLPLLVRNGFRGPVHCTPATADLLGVLLPDSGHLHEEDAERANRYGYTKHRPAKPLYTEADAVASLRQLEVHAHGAEFAVGEDLRVTFRRAGHIMGSATVTLAIAGPRSRTLVFSGDLGRWDRPILRDPEPVREADVLLIESTYGDRVHAPDAPGELARIVNDAVRRGGALLVPSFAVGRTQELIWNLRRLEEEGRIPLLPVFVDSPMAIDVTEIYCRHPDEHDLEMELLMDAKRCPLCCGRHHVLRTPEESKSLNRLNGPMVIVSASGMATGGRVLHHLKLRLPDHRTTVLLPGFQAAGTRGRSLQEGAQTLRIHGEDVPVRATIETLDGLSAHADREEILRWLGGFRRPPRRTYVVHGEPDSAQALASAIQSRLGWSAQVAREGQNVVL